MTTPQHTPPHEVVARALGRYGGQWDWSPGSAHAAVRQCRMDADRALAALTAAGYRIIQTDRVKQLEIALRLALAAWDAEHGLDQPGVLLSSAAAIADARRVVGNEQDTPR
jgi:hypothetical protein